ncbi:hypothetical protein [Streptomyces sp. enrichment culture]|uniref:hypothetical protein n=1 Tax=Streptomyces sp. enrichment culture TaxID=1795815 RepID=UPI003F57AD70
METTGVVSLLSFHARTQEALSFARGLPDAADELRAAGRFPGQIWGEWLCGLHPAAHQRAVLGQIAGGVDAEGRKTEFRILATCRLLGEGTDITGRSAWTACCSPDAAELQRPRFPTSCRRSAGPCGRHRTRARSPASWCPFC